MPKSKRNRPVTLSKTKKKGREHKESIVNSIRDAVEKYNSIYVFSFENMRNLKFKEFREQHKLTSRFFLGSNKVMQVSLGRSAADEIRPGLHKVSKLVCGDSGLFLTNLSREEVERLFNEYEEYDFARTGTSATQTVELKEGPLEQFTHEMEPFLRKQGMPVRLNKGVIELVSNFVVCEEGKPLSPESSRILRLLGTKMATFRLHLICRWSPEDFELYREGLDESDFKVIQEEDPFFIQFSTDKLLWSLSQHPNPNQTFLSSIHQVWYIRIWIIGFDYGLMMMTIEEPFRPREKLLEKQRYFQSIHKHTYLKGPLDKITSVAIPLAFAGTTLYLIGRGIYNMSHGIGKKE
ncbi:acidic ribosomal protein P0 [Populus alba x Populus x berolinensis]|nr:acidic ribosomal protein P0 [Populus alba x Populus x berolinensis]